MKWITRARPKTDRIACSWLIAKFIDPAVEILYVPAGQVLEEAERAGAISFDAPGARYAHRDGKCTFEVLIEDCDLAGTRRWRGWPRSCTPPTSPTTLAPTRPGRDCWPSASAGWTWKPTTIGSWERAGSSTTLSAPGASARSRPRHERRRRLRGTARRHRPPGRPAHGRRSDHRPETRRTAVPRRQAPARLKAEKLSGDGGTGAQPRGPCLGRSSIG